MGYSIQAYVTVYYVLVNAYMRSLVGAYLRALFRRRMNNGRHDVPVSFCSDEQHDNSAVCRDALQQHIHYAWIFQYVDRCDRLFLVVLTCHIIGQQSGKISCTHGGHDHAVFLNTVCECADDRIVCVSNCSCDRALLSVVVFFLEKVHCVNVLANTVYTNKMVT